MHGFTTLRDMETEGAMYADVDLKKAIVRGVIDGPRLFVSTRSINTTGHYPLPNSLYTWEIHMPKGVQEITGQAEARRAVREQLSYGADWIKIYADRGYYRGADGAFHSLPNFTDDELRSIADSVRAWPPPSTVIVVVESRCQPRSDVLPLPHVSRRFRY